LLISAFLISISLTSYFIFLLNKAGEFFAPILVSMYFLFALIFSYLFGFLSDKYRNRKIFIIFGECFAASCFFSIYFINNYIGLLVIAALIGIAQAAYTPLFIALFSDIHFKMTKGKIAGIINSTFSLGWAVGAIMGGLIEEIFGLNFVFIVMGMIAILSVIPILLVKINRKKVDIDLEKYNRSKSSENPLNENSKVNLGYKSLMIVLMISICLRFICSQAAVVSLLPNFLEFKLNTPAFLKGVILSINMIFQVFMMLILGVISERLGRKSILFLGLLGSGLNSIFYSLATSPWQVIPNQFLIGFSYAAVITSSTAIISDISHFKLIGRGLGVLETARSLGGMIGPFMAFFLIEISYRFAFQVLGIFGLISAFILIILLAENRKNKKYRIRFVEMKIK
jgi:MFS family permease